MEDRFKTSEDAEARYEKLVSEIKRLHSPLIFQQKMQNFKLTKITFEADAHTVILVFTKDKKDAPSEEAEFHLYHKQPLFCINFCSQSYSENDFDLSEEYQKEVIKDIALINSAIPVGELTAEQEYKDRIAYESERNRKYKEKMKREPRDLGDYDGDRDWEYEKQVKEAEELERKEPNVVTLKPNLN